MLRAGGPPPGPRAGSCGRPWLLMVLMLLRLLMLLSLAQAGGPQHACSAVGLQAVVWQACVGVALALEQLCR